MNTLTTFFMVALVVAASAWASTSIVFRGDRETTSEQQDAATAVKFDPAIGSSGRSFGVCAYHFAQIGPPRASETHRSGLNMDLWNPDIPHSHDVPQVDGEIDGQQETGC